MHAKYFLFNFYLIPIEYDDVFAKHFITNNDYNDLEKSIFLAGKKYTTALAGIKFIFL